SRARQLGADWRAGWRIHESGIALRRERDRFLDAFRHGGAIATRIEAYSERGDQTLERRSTVRFVADQLILNAARSDRRADSVDPFLDQSVEIVRIGCGVGAAPGVRS